MQRQISRIIDQQGAWAGPLGGRAEHWLAGLFAERRRVKDLLNGTWLGHPVHPMVTDVPVGALTVAVLLDATGQDRAADLAVVTGLAGMAASAATGAADAVDTYGRPQLLATVHASLMVTSFTAYSGSLLLRIGPRAGRPLGRLLALAGYATLAAGAYVGGDLTYRAGNQVDRHAFETGGAKWKALDVREVPAAELVRARLGTVPIVLFRAEEGSPITAISATCAHAGGPLDKGTVSEGCVVCPWHGSRFRLGDGHVVGGPAVYDQPAYEVRETDDGGLEARRAPASPG